MKIVASGTTGTIGKHLGNTVTALNQRLNSLEEYSLNLSQSDTYIHLGAMVGSQDVLNNPSISRQINIESTIRLAEHCLATNLNKFIFISTSHVYSSNSQIKSEQSDINPINAYANQKYEAESKLRAIFLGNEEKLLVIRVFSILDWDTKPFTLGGAVNRMFLDDEFKLTCGDDIRDFLTPRQAAKAIVEIAKKKISVSTLNLCTGKSISIAQAAKIMLSERTSADWTERIIDGNSDVPNIVGDPSTLNTILATPLTWSYLNR